MAHHNGTLIRLVCLGLLTACGPPTSTYDSRRDAGATTNDGGSQVDAGEIVDTGPVVTVHPEIIARCERVVATIQASCPNDMDDFTEFCQQQMLYEDNGQIVAVYSEAAINACLTTYLTNCDLPALRRCLATFP